jgi:hypothetical protein
VLRELGAGARGDLRGFARAGTIVVGLPNTPAAFARTLIGLRRAARRGKRHPQPDADAPIRVESLVGAEDGAALEGSQ